MNVLISFYYTIDTQKGFEKFFSRHAPWVFDNIQRYHNRTGISWWESKDASELWLDHERVRRIINDYFDEKILKTYLLKWLRDLAEKLVLHLTVEPSFDYRAGENINLEKHQVVEVTRDALYGISLEPLFREILAELLKMLREEKTGIRRCSSCKKLFEPSSRGHQQKFCNATCKMRFYRKHRENY